MAWLATEDNRSAVSARDILFTMTQIAEETTTLLEMNSTRVFHLRFFNSVGPSLAQSSICCIFLMEFKLDFLCLFVIYRKIRNEMRAIIAVSLLISAVASPIWDYVNVSLHFNQYPYCSALDFLVACYSFLSPLYVDSDAR